MPAMNAMMPTEWRCPSIAFVPKNVAFFNSLVLSEALYTVVTFTDAWAGVTGPALLETGPTPPRLTARTVALTAVPFVSPVTTARRALPGTYTVLDPTVTA